MPAARADDLASIIRQVLSAELPDYHPHFYEYFGECSEPAAVDKWVRHREDLLQVGTIQRLDDRVAVEVGCGYGFGLIHFASLGASKSQGIDISPGMISTILAYKALLPAPWRDRIEASVGDAAALPYETASVDVVLSNEAISHYHDVDRFVAEAARVLRPGGVLLVADGNNALNPITRRRNRRWFREVEYGPVHGKGVFTLPFVEKRQRLIADEFPEFAADASELADRTFGMSTEEIIAALNKLRAGGSAPAETFDRDRVPRDPETGQVIERLIDPRQLARKLRAAGFRSTKVLGYWGGASGKPLLRIANRALAAASPATIYSARAFRIAAWR